MTSLAQSPLFFHRFERRALVELQLEAVTAFRIGVGRAHDPTTTDLPVLRDASGQPVIPGSSLKGVARSQLEGLLRSRGLRVCDPLAQPCISERPDDDEKPAKDRAAEWRTHIQSSICRVCEIFGAPGLASHVTFSEARPAADRPWHTTVRDGVAIDRDLGRVAGPRKYDFEVVEAGAVFDVRVTMENLDHRREGAVLYGLQLIAEGFASVGGFASRGLGVMRRVGEPRVREMTAVSVSPIPARWEQWASQRLQAFERWLHEGEA